MRLVTVDGRGLTFEAQGSVVDGRWEHAITMGAASDAVEVEFDQDERLIVVGDLSAPPTLGDPEVNPTETTRYQLSLNNWAGFAAKNNRQSFTTLDVPQVEASNPLADRYEVLSSHRWRLDMRDGTLFPTNRVETQLCLGWTGSWAFLCNRDDERALRFRIPSGCNPHNALGAPYFPNNGAVKGGQVEVADAPCGCGVRYFSVPFLPLLPVCVWKVREGPDAFRNFSSSAHKFVFIDRNRVAGQARDGGDAR